MNKKIARIIYTHYLFYGGYMFASDSFRKNKMTVLLVDDEDSFRLVLKEVLSSIPEFEVLDCD